MNSTRGARSKALILLAAFGLFVATQAASAVTIQFHYGDGFPEGSPQRQALDQAADRWETRLHDPVVVTIDAMFADLSNPDVDFLGVSEPERVAFPYVDIREALLNDATSMDDRTAIGYLPPGPDLAFRTHDPQGKVITSDAGKTINRVLSLTTANAKALQLTVPDEPEQVDGTIRFNQDLLGKLRADFDPSNGVRGWDFVGTGGSRDWPRAGTRSVVWRSWTILHLPDGPDAPRDISGQPVLSTWDLFRYSPESLPLLDLTPGGRPYFSIDGGATELARLASGQFNGDGSQSGALDARPRLLMDPM